MERCAPSTRLAEERNVELTVQDDGSPLVGHRDDLERMLRNLVENAVRYSPVGGHVSVQVTSTDGSVRISVEDDGPGVSDEEQARIFEPFYRSPRSRAVAPEGAGLGLAIAREIASAHRGDVHRSTKPRERGAEFVVLLPLPQVDGDERDGAVVHGH